MPKTAPHPFGSKPGTRGLRRLSTRIAGAALLFFGTVQAQLLPTLEPFNASLRAGADDVSAVQVVNGRLWAGGNFRNISGGNMYGLARLNDNGSLDTSITPPTLNNLVRVIRPHGAHIYVGGAFTSVNQELRPYFFRMNSNGQVDTSFQPLRGITPWTGWGVVDFLIQPDGKIITAGKFLPDDDPDTASPSAFIARLHPDGSLDAEFNQDFELGAYSHINSTARQSNGKLLLAGRFFTIYGAPRDHLIRLDVNGQFDPSFHNVEIGNELEKVIVSPDDSLMVAGSDIAMHQGIRYNHVARLKSNGEIDPAFRAAEFTSVLTYGVYAFDIVKAREGGWVVAGRFTHLDGELRTGLAWLNEDGSLNTEMASADIQGVDVKHLRVPPQRPNLLLVAGKFSHVQGESRNQLTLLKIPRFSIFQDGFEDP